MLEGTIQNISKVMKQLSKKENKLNLTIFLKNQFKFIIQHKVNYINQTIMKFL